MKILLTGASGFIGRNLFEAWNKHYDISAPTHQELDLCDTQAVENYLRRGCFDVVVHSANTNDFRHQVKRKDILEYNLQMFCNLERCSALYAKLIYFGSGAEYGMERPLCHVREIEFGDRIPQDVYGFSKYIMSKLTGQSENIYDLRLFGIFGQYEEWERRFISNMICRNLKGYPMEMQQERLFDYLYIDDLRRILEWFLGHEPKHRHYNVCTGQEVSLYNLAQLVNEISESPQPIMVSKEGQGSKYVGDNSRLLREMVDFSFTPIREAIEKLWIYYRSNAEHIDEAKF